MAGIERKGVTSRRRWVAASPFLIVAVGHLAARIAVRHLGAWAWLPVFAIYLASMVAVVWLSGSLPQVRRAYRRASGRTWWVFEIAIGLLPFPILWLHRALLGHLWLTCWWLLVALMNPFVEESYWRGALGEATRSWPAWLACMYSSALFAMSHPLMWGVFSRLNRRPDTLISLLLMGLVWSAGYRRTGSLRSATVSHMLVDVGNLSVFAFLNLFAPPASF